MPPGSYALVLRDGDATAEATIGLSDGAERVVTGLAFHSREIELASAKGSTTVEGVVDQWKRQANQALTTLLGDPAPTRAPELASVDAARANEWPGDAAPLLACADRGQGCLRDALRSVDHPDGPIAGHTAEGAPAFVGVSTNGLPTGFWTFFHPSGDKRCEGAFVDGVKTGWWTCSYESGATESRVEYRTDFEGGTRSEYHANGQKKRRVEMVRGIPSGRAVEWYENGRKKSDGRYAGGHPIGTWTYFFESGAKQEQGRFDDHGKKGRWLSWYVNGQKASDGHYVKDARDGKWLLWWPDGRKKATARTSAGSRSGTGASGTRTASGRRKAGTTRACERVSGASGIRRATASTTIDGVERNERRPGAHRDAGWYTRAGRCPTQTTAQGSSTASTLAGRSRSKCTSRRWVGTSA